MGGGSSSSTPVGGIEAPNTLISNMRVKIVDVIGEGVIGGFWIQTGVSGNSPLASILLNDTPIINGDGSANFNISGQGFKWDFVSGTSFQMPMSGFEKVEALVPLPVNTQVTNPPPNNGFPKPVVVSFNTSMYPDAEGVKVTIRIPQLFTVDQKMGNTNQYNISWIVECSLNNGDWQTLDIQDIRGKCTSPYWKTSVYPLPKTTPASTFYQWKLRVRRLSVAVLSAGTANDMYVDNIAVVSSNSYRYPTTALVGLEMAANQFGDIPSRAYDVKGIKVQVPEGYEPTVYNETSFVRQCDYDAGNKLVGMTVQSAAEMNGLALGTTVIGPGIPPGSVIVAININDPAPGYYFAIDKEPTSTEVGMNLTFQSYTYGTITPAVYPPIWNGVWATEHKWTDNPAFILYDLCTNKRYGLGNYIRTEWMDKWTIYQIAQYCDELVDDGDGGLEPRFTCNIAIQSPEDAYTLLNNLVSVFRGMLYWANGRIFPVGPETRDPVFNFSNANVVGGSFSYSDSPRNTRSTVCTVRWNDPDNLFRSTAERIEDPNARAKYGIIEKQITAFATTSRGQAVRAANWMLTTEQQLTDIVQFETDLEGLYLRPGDVINIYDNLRNNQQQGGRITDFNQAHDLITLDKAVNLQPSFTYYMTALVPAANIANGSGITGSNQFGLIRNSQIEARRITTLAGTGITVVALESGFSPALFRGSVFNLSASGDTVTVFDKATQYKVLSVGSTSPSSYGIMAVEYQTGINYLVNNNYSIVTNPPIEGNTTPPTAPVGVQSYRVTGLLNNNTFFSYAYIDWTGTAPGNTAYYDVSGRLGIGPWFSIGQPTTTGVQFVPPEIGGYSLAVAAVNANGYRSANATGTYIEPDTNPFGNTAPLSGIIIAQNYDPYSFSVALNRYTGFIGTQPTFLWDVALDGIDDELETPSAQFVTGYRVQLKNAVDGTTDLLPEPIIIEGKDNNSLTWNSDFLFTGTSIKALRTFIIDVQTLDSFGQVASGARLAVNNIQPPPPVASGFVGFNGGVSYNITPPRVGDISGVYLWTATGTSFAPTFDNPTLVSTNLAGFVNGPQRGNVYTWFALTDSFGPSGSRGGLGDYNAPIYGPISGNADQMFGAFSLDISEEINEAFNTISGAFNLLTGTFTQYIQELSGQNQQTLLMVEGLSGQTVGTTPGAANTALNVRVNLAVTSSSGALSQQINAVSARLETTGSTLNATVGQVSTALTQSGIVLGSQINVVSANLAITGAGLNTRLGATGATLLQAQATADGALAQWITNLGVQTTGVSAAIRIGAEALVTGAVNGIGGAAIARYGFELNAGTNRASLVATTTSFPGSQSKLELENFDIQSNSFSAGNQGWRIQYNGDAEFNNISARGAFTGGSVTTTMAVIDTIGLRVGNLSADRVTIGSTANKGIIFGYADNNVNAYQLGWANIGGSRVGYATINNAAGSAGVTIRGQGTSEFNTQVNITSTNKLLWSANPSNTTYIDENFGMNLWGDSTHPVRIRSAALLLNESAVGSFNAGWVYDLNGDHILRERYPGTPVTLGDVITVLQYMGFCN